MNPSAASLTRAGLAASLLCLAASLRAQGDSASAGTPEFCCASPSAADGASSAAWTGRSSVYDQPTMWETDCGNKFALAELRGHASIVALFYTSCHVACPATLHELIDVERRLPPDSKINIVLVTIDPQTDTPATLAECREENRLTERFVLLRGSPAQTRAFADAAGILFRQEPERLVHVPKVVVLGVDGKVAASFPGTHSNTEDMAHAALRAERSDPGS